MNNFQWFQMCILICIESRVHIAFQSEKFVPFHLGDQLADEENLNDGGYPIVMRSSKGPDRA